MARSKEIDLASLLSMEIDGVCALHVYLPYLKVGGCKDMDLRCRRFVAFLEWASSDEVEAHWEPNLLAQYAEHLRTLGNSERTVSDKVSNIRQFILCAEAEDVIPQVVVYAKRGRKPKERPSIPKVFVGKPLRTSRTKHISGFKKTFVYDLFGMEMETFSSDALKRSYRRLATLLHPDHSDCSPEYFLACNDAYKFLMSSVRRLSYNQYIQGKSYTTQVTDFVRDVYNRIGGYPTLNKLLCA